MRIFVGLDIDNVIRERIQRFLEGVRGFAPEARWVRSESLHITLKFIGEASEEVVKQTKAVLSTVQASDVEMAFRGYGFSLGAKTARVFWLGIETGPQLGALAAAVDNATSTLGIPKEEHPFSPHLTLARGGGRSGSPRRQKDDGANLIFQRLQEKLTILPTPDFGTMATREFFLFQSQTLPDGARYSKLASFAIG